MIISDESGTIIEQPESSEVYERLPEPETKHLAVGAEWELVQMWRARIEVARKMRDIKLKDLQTLIDMYEGIQWHTDDNFFAIQDKATVNLIFANIKKEMPYLYFQNPAPIVNASENEFELGAFAMKELLTFYAKYNLKTEMKRHMRLCILDAKFSFGVNKVTYTPRFSPNPNKGKPTVAGIDDFGIPVFVYDEEGNVVTESGTILTSELYNVERISPREILIDPECRNFVERAKWIGHEIIKPLSYLKKHDLYENTEHLMKNIELSEVFKNTLNKTQEEISAAKGLYKDDNEKVRFVEIYDIENNKLFVLPDDRDFFIRKENIRMNPFSFLKFNESPDNFHPIPDVRIEKPLQQEVNVGRSMLITHARRSARKYYYTQATFQGIDDAQGIDAAKNPEDMTFFEIADYSQPPMPLALAQQDQSVFQNLIQSRLDFNIVSDSTESQRGASERRKTKGEATFQEGHAAVRRSDKQNLIADFMTDTYAKLGELMQNTLSVAQAVKIIGAEGIFWTQIIRDDIQGKFSYDIEVSELRPQIPEMDRQELTEFTLSLSNILNVIVANPILLQVFNVQGLIKEFAKSYPSLDVANILNMKVTPEQIAQMALQQMQKGGQ